MRLSATTRGSMRSFAVVLVLLAALLTKPATADNTAATIERIKGSVVALGTFQRTRAPAFKFLATGFAVGDGSLIATNAHALPIALDGERREILAILIPFGDRETQLREARQVAIDLGTDLAVLSINGKGLPPLKLRDSDSVKEGQSVLFTGFPLGSV